MPPTDEAPNGSYYRDGSTEKATLTALTAKKLEKRRILTANSDRLVIVLVGLPGRGKSFVARKLLSFLTWRGTGCRVFNVGKYRREAHASSLAAEGGRGPGGDGGGTDRRTPPEGEGEIERRGRKESGSCDADFFDGRNERASRLREEVARIALADMLRWLDYGDGGGPAATTPPPPPPVSPGGGDPAPPPPGPAAGRAYRRQGSSVCNATDWMRSDEERVAIFDATNSTRDRRSWVLEECTAPHKRPGRPTGIVFVESICDDEELLEENFRFKVKNSPDFRGMTEGEAMDDLRRRVRKYEEQYETITDDGLSYIKIYNLSSKLMVNHIYGRMAKVIVPALMSWNIGSRPICICRSGATLGLSDSRHALREGALGDGGSGGGGGGGGGGSPGSAAAASPAALRSTSRGSALSPDGLRFRDALCSFIYGEGMEFMAHLKDATRDLTTGTSVNGLMRTHSWGHLRGLCQERSLDGGGGGKGGGGMDDGGTHFPFPCHIMSSTMPRSRQTVTWESLPYPVEELSNLNPLDKGDFTGHELEDIADIDPRWYADLERDPFRTRFPGGECYGDLINRLEPAIIDMEQQVGPVVVVSHISVIQALIAYFRQDPVRECTSLEVPLHTVIKYTPARGGGWVESRHRLLEDDDEDDDEGEGGGSTSSPRSSAAEGEAVAAPAQADRSPAPIWCDDKPPMKKISLRKDVTALGQALLGEGMGPPSF